jgi:nitrite reductase/ring-hydroxylating ferredoxin subunit
MERQAIFECPLDDLEDRDARGFAWRDDDRQREGFVVRRGDAVFAYHNVCPHAGNVLNWKPHAFLTRSRDLIMCSVHGAIFEIASGRCVGGPCPGRRLQPLRAEIRRGRIVVYPG